MFEELAPHIAELRKRLAISVAAVFIGFLASYGFWEIIVAWMSHPLYEVLPKDIKLIYTGPIEAFITAIKVSFFAGLVLTLPIVFWQFWLFVAPGLYEHEKKYVIPFVLFATIFFLSGAAFCYYVVLPLGLNFLMNFGGELFTAMPRLGEYVGFFTKLLIAFGLAFELPVLTFFLAKLGLITDESLKNNFRYAIVIIFIFAAILTPPDVITQFLMAAPLMLLYGLSILIAKAVNPAPKVEDDNE